MTGIERLREFAEGISPFTVVCGVTTTSYDREHTEVEGARLRDFLSDIVDQIERERACNADTIENIRPIVGGVVDEMERHVLGHEGMEDSPVARWARELREALGGDGRDPAADVSVSACDPPSQEDREAIAWVREHGGLDAVKRRWECLSYYADPVPRSCMEKRLARLQRQIDESHAALRRRREIISELNRRATDLTRENAERGETIRKLSDRAAKQSDEIRVMRDVIAETCARLGVEGTGSTVDDAQVIWREIARRLMPDGMCWPVFEDGEPVRIGDFVSDVEVRSVVFRDGGILLSDCTSVPGWGTWRSYKEPIKRPAPKVLDADGAEIREKRDVWWICEGDERGVHAERLRVETICPNGLVECSPYNGGTWVELEPSELYANKPVLAADGEPLEVGQTVWHRSGHAHGVVESIDAGSLMHTVRYRSDGGEEYRDAAKDLTHQRPVLAADGKPLRDGEHVYHVETGAELVVKKLPKPGEYQAVIVFALPTSPASHLTSFDPDQLTHERPDSWERLEEDANKGSCDYFGCDANGCHGCPAYGWNTARGGSGCGNAKMRDIVRRAKKLAERGQ